MDLRFQVESSMRRMCVHLLFGGSSHCCFWRQRIARLTSPKHTSPHRSRAAAPSAKSISAKAIGRLVMPGGTLAAVQWYVAAPAMPDQPSRRKSRGQSTVTIVGGVCGVFDPAVSAEIQLQDTPALVRLRREDHHLRCFWHKLTVWY